MSINFGANRCLGFTLEHFKLVRIPFSSYTHVLIVSDFTMFELWTREQEKRFLRNWIILQVLFEVLFCPEWNLTSKPPSFFFPIIIEEGNHLVTFSTLAHSQIPTNGKSYFLHPTSMLNILFLKCFSTYFRRIHFLTSRAW